ncbi:Sec region non-globular protein [Leptospira ryugenii]|uniref:Sec region non-globular protein n=1 Tax=Leptospira ryugenii TaxID=1917863 RepID=A0A2P2DY51_9LEPT|nr:SRP-less Sec system protein [Leptospira ryugenii]GBF49520.1 Sec region non-globular protein [Leptospira ryugenii]
MKQTWLSLLLILFFVGEVYSQDNLDFLDKVNDKPKTVTKSKEETIQTNQVQSKDKKSVSSTSKKKKKKKNKENQTLPNTALVDNGSNLVPSDSKPILPKVEETKKEEEVVMQGKWINPKIQIEPEGLPGFGKEVTYGKEAETIKSTVDSSAGNAGSPSKSLFSFKDFFDKYKKAMLILGIIILFAFYRLRMARPSSSSRSYRR